MAQEHSIEIFSKSFSASASSFTLFERNDILHQNFIRINYGSDGASCSIFQRPEFIEKYEELSVDYFFTIQERLIPTE